MAGKLDGARIIVTGASRGIGYETTARFLREGARVLGSARDAVRLSAAQRDFLALGSGEFSLVVCDLERPGEEARIAEAARQRWGAVDVLVNNAAVMLSNDDSYGFLQEAPEVIERTMAVNVLAPMRLIRAVVPLLERSDHPRIINVSSGAGAFAALDSQGLASYRLSKWALNGLTLLLASQLRGKVLVNALDPGWVKTDMGGPNAPGSPTESAEGALALATEPSGATGKFWKNGEQIDF